ncbi:hypothetical protein, partial [Paraburkholderia hospita]|uniref:hypothetical protein n=1 Tax=Paraburkholderia hospita TaxID=169430 RepID=UPI000B3498CD
MGPITLFDKSFLQTLSTDESVWFDQFFYPVIAPLFYIETLADLEKKPREGKTAEEEVGIIAAKTPEMHGAPCFFHAELCIQDMLGRAVPLTGQIPMARGKSVMRDGKLGAVYDEPEEAKAFARWQRGRFYDVERTHARQWRAQIAGVDLAAIKKAMENAGITPKTCKTLADAVAMADTAVKALTKSTGRFDAMLTVLEVPERLRRHVKDRWKRLKQPPLSVFAPYAAHVLKVEIFFRIGLGAHLISSDRASHRVDMAYLFYLPFCQVFVSTDKLHRTCAPLFLRPDQSFAWGADVKTDLTTLNRHFAALPDEIKAQGVYKFARRLPDESNGIIRDLFARHTPRLLGPAAEDTKPHPCTGSDCLDTVLQ